MGLQAPLQTMHRSSPIAWVVWWPYWTGVRSTLSGLENRPGCVMREGREEHFPLHDQSPIIHRSIPSSKTNTYKASVDTSFTSTRSGSFTPQSLWNRPPAHTHRTHHCRLGPTVNLGIHPRTATHHRHFLTDKTMYPIHPSIIIYHISYISSTHQQHSRVDQGMLSVVL